MWDEQGGPLSPGDPWPPGEVGQAETLQFYHGRHRAEDAVPPPGTRSTMDSLAMEAAKEYIVGGRRPFYELDPETMQRLSDKPQYFSKRSRPE